MNKIKKYYINSIQAFLVSAFVIASVLTYIVPLPKLSAAAPGCYQVYGTTTGDSTITTYEPVTCPNSDLGRGVSTGQCYVAQVGQRGAIGAYNTRDCDSFNVGQTTSNRADEEASTPVAIDCEAEELTRDNCGIINYLVITINFLSAVAVMAIVASVMFAGYQYMTARDNPGQVTAAKKRIVWAMVALGLFVFGYALLNFLVPGGVL